MSSGTLPLGPCVATLSTSSFAKKGTTFIYMKTFFKLDLEQVDAVVGWLDAKYTGLAFAEGATAGAAGVLGLIADIPALVTLNLRAIAEYATYYGFDVASQRERVFAMNVLGLASSPSDAAKSACDGSVGENRC